MNKLKHNEQTESDFIDATDIYDAALSVYKNENYDNKRSKSRQTRAFKIRAYHPKMMIAYKNGFILNKG